MIDDANVLRAIQESIKTGFEPRASRRRNPDCAEIASFYYARCMKDRRLICTPARNRFVRGKIHRTRARNGPQDEAARCVRRSRPAELVVSAVG
jgi:hypothetical protein